VCKWLKILLKSFSQHLSDHFKLFRSILALKLTELQTFEILNIFGSSSFGRRPKNIEESLLNVCRPADFFLENFKKVISGLESSFKCFCGNIKFFFDIIEVSCGLESSFKYCCDNLKWLLIKSFEEMNTIKQVGRVDNVGHADPVGHVDWVQHDNIVHLDNNGGNVNRLHVGLINGDSIDYNDKPGDEVPFIILKKFRLLLRLLLLSFKCLRKLNGFFCLDHFLCLVCLASLDLSKMIPIILNITIVQLVCMFCLILMKFYHLTCCLAAPPYHFGVRAIKYEVRLLIACAKYSRKGLEVVLVLSRRLMQMIGVRAWILCGGWGMENKNVRELVRVGLEVVLVLSRMLVRVIGVGKVTEKIRRIGKQLVKFVIINTFISSSSARMSITSIVSKPSIIYQLNIIRQVK